MSRMKKKVVVIGGGTGTYTVLSGLKKYPLDLTAIVTASDSGGSTGKLRDEFGSLPVGDVRMALAALSDDPEESNFLRKLFLYRFDKGDGLKGHNFGNLFLVAMAEVLGSQEQAILYASEILRVKGKVLPVSERDSHLVAEYENGQLVFGETHIDEPGDGFDGKMRIKKLWMQPEVKISDSAKKAILNADIIVIGPGDLYTSLLANVVVSGVPEAIKKSKAKLVFVVNLIAKWGQTFDFNVSDHVEEFKKYVGKYPDYVLVNDKALPKSILKKYELENGGPVRDDLLRKNTPYKVVRADLLGEEVIKKSSGDVLKRSLIRHDSQKLARVVYNLV